ncbi:MAG: tRNA (adenine(22)-N(1))-methyltransferase [Eubacterium sp.]
MLSKRLDAVAKMVTKGNIVADIGTDHGYVPIYLVKSKISPFAYAMDINDGPVKSALRNVNSEGLSKQIQVIQSDGMEKLRPDMADTVIIAGMGGELIVDILKKSTVNDTVKEFVLSPHKRADLVRKFINENGWHIIEERMLVDAGKYYTIMKAVKGEETEPYCEAEYRYGRYLLNEKNPVLKEYLEKEYKKFKNIKDRMEKNNSRGTEQVEQVLEYNREGRESYDSCKCRRQGLQV